MSSNDSLKMIAFLLILVLTGCYRTNKVEGSYIRYNDHLLENLEYIPFVLSNMKRNNDMEKKLVYRYSDAICEKCVSEDLELLDSFQNVIGRNHVFIYTLNSATL